MGNKDRAPCCEECVKFEKFAKDCWVYWDLKKNCSMHAKDWSEDSLQ